jgi:hypothetical protein
MAWIVLRLDKRESSGDFDQQNELENGVAGELGTLNRRDIQGAVEGMENTEIRAATKFHQISWRA